MTKVLVVLFIVFHWIIIVYAYGCYHRFLFKTKSSRIFLTFQQFKNSFNLNPDAWHINLCGLASSWCYDIGKFEGSCQELVKIDFVNYIEYMRALHYINHLHIKKQKKEKNIILNQIISNQTSSITKDMSLRTAQDKSKELDQMLKDLIEKYQNEK